MKHLLLAVALTFSATTLAEEVKVPVKQEVVQASEAKADTVTVKAADAAEANIPVVDEPKDLGEAVGLLSTIITAAKNSNWLLFGALVALVLTFVVKTYVLPHTPVGNGVLPWVSLVLGLLSGVGGAVAAGATLEAALLAVLAGPVGSLIWDAIAKYFFGNKSPA